MIGTTLVMGMSAFDRELAIIAELNANAESTLLPQKSAVLLEGLSDGQLLLTPTENLIITRIAAGCLCCSNTMIMRIYLNRLIQQKPQQLFLSLSNAAHVEKITEFLSTPAYINLLKINGVLNLDPGSGNAAS